MQEESYKKDTKYVRPANLLPWVEKYRPQKIDQVSHQEEVIGALSGVLRTGNLPHLLMHGPPGTGKTSTVLALAKQLYGPNFYRERVLELNASDDRGINVVREKIKNFAQKLVAQSHDKNYLCPNYSIIILDEADSMTSEAQSALRRIIEDFSKTTRFCIICNYITKIIEPLTSRCLKFRFKPISFEAQMLKLQEICGKENLQVEESAIVKLIQVSNGDLRKSVNLLQSAKSLIGDNLITEQFIYEISGILPQHKICKLFQSVFTGSLQTVIKETQELLMEGYSPEQTIQQLTDEVLQNEFISETQKAKILEQIAQMDKALNEGSDNEIQLINLLSQCISIVQ